MKRGSQCTLLAFLVLVVVATVVQAVRDNDLLVDLSGVSVHCHLVHQTKKPHTYWKQIRKFWTAYVEEECGGEMGMFTMFEYRGN